jgi:predicted nucleotide-binding protein (sugar kinase/HSP70/actin superfamily)
MLLASGWSKQQVAAAVLHSVCDNYLNKVVNHLHIGNRIYFQGATARNKALVAAFEQRLGKRITVSPFCHMTGALGISLLLLDQLEEKNRQTAQVGSFSGRFRGLQFADTPVKCETEKCDLCANHCSLSLISTEDETVAWGLMCGREYADKRPRTRTISAAALIEERHRLLMGEDGGPEPRASATGESTPASRGATCAPKAIVGIPKTLTMWTYLPLWRAFFRELGIDILPSSPARDTVFKRGQQYVTAEFCAPVIVSHGHVADLLEKKIDFLFIPHLVREQTTPGFSNNHFCCYVQAHPAVIQSLNTLETADRLLSPVIDFRFGFDHVVDKLHEELGAPLTRSKRAIRRALKVALDGQRSFGEKVLQMGSTALQSLEARDEMGIALIGRPYNTLDPCMNLQLPGKIAERGYDIFFQDMLPTDVESISDDYSNMYWNSGQQILAASRFVAEHNNLFAIYFTSFSCGPDSYLLSYFKDEMARRKKPYLVLQFDGHGADAGYMTRVEAALESFKAWRCDGERVSNKTSATGTLTPLDRLGAGYGLAPGGNAGPARLRVLLKTQKNAGSPVRNVRPTGALFPSLDDLRRRVLFVPPMEPIAARLFAAAFRGAGFNAQVLEENPRTLAVGLQHTGGGECVPCPTTMGSLIHTVEERSLHPKDVAFFMATAVGPCRFGQYNKLNELVLRRKGWNELRILAPSAANNYEGIDGALRKKLWDVFVVGDILRKMLLRTRPYEVRPGSADFTLERALVSMEQEFERANGSVESVLREAVRLFKNLGTKGPPKPKVGVVGEIYVRCNPFTNDNVIRAIEALGGEALLASLSEWILYVHFLNVQNSRLTGFKLGERLGLFLTGRFYHKRERALFKIAEEIIGDRDDPPLEKIIAEGARFVPRQFQGEAILTLGRAACFIKNEDVSAVVNASPMFCMPGTTTAAIFPSLERELGVPIICNFYDGSGDPNRSLIPYMHYIKDSLDKEIPNSRRQISDKF